MVIQEEEQRIEPLVDLTTQQYQDVARLLETTVLPVDAVVLDLVEFVQVVLLEEVLDL